MKDLKTCSLDLEIKAKADKKEGISCNVTLINAVMCMLCNGVWQSCTVNDSTCGFMSCLSSLLPTVICSRDSHVEKHTGPLPHSSDGSNDQIEVYRNHFTVLPQELKHIQKKAEIQSSINNRTNGWKKKKAEIAQMCTLFLFINHNNNALRDFCVFS